MTRIETTLLLETYYEAFNAGAWDQMVDCLADHVAHDLNQGERQVGKDRFRAFLDHMALCYRERLEDIVLLVSENGSRAAAEFTVHGEYLATDEGLPQASGQTYCLPAGAFLTIADSKISRLTMYYNLADWLRQIEGQ